MAEIAGTRVLVTGASGFIGSHVVRRLVAERADVHALTSNVSSVYPTRLVDLRDQITLHEGSLIDRSAMDALVADVQPRYVLHLAAYTHVGKSWQRVDECIQVNVQGTVNLLQALAGSPYERFVSTGTSEIYGDVPVPFRENGPVNPISPYSVSKYAAEQFCRILCSGRDWPIVMLRPFNAYGPAQTPDRVIPEIIMRALRRQPLRMTDARQTREFNFVSDLADGFVRAATTPGIEGEVINLCCGQDIAIRDLAVRILDLLDNPIEPQFGALPNRPTEIWQMYGDSDKARRLLDWEPHTTLDDGLRETIDWYQAELDRGDSLFVP